MRAGEFPKTIVAPLLRDFIGPLLEQIELMKIDQQIGSGWRPAEHSAYTGLLPQGLGQDWCAKQNGRYRDQLHAGSFPDKREIRTLVHWMAAAANTAAAATGARRASPC